jgi:hypothetical protein
MPEKKERKEWLIYVPRWMFSDNRTRFMLSASPLEFGLDVNYARRYTQTQAKRIEDRMWLTQGVVTIRETDRQLLLLANA